MAHYSTQWHSHYCSACKGFSPCAGAFPTNGDCLLTDSCAGCGGVLQGTASAPILVGDDVPCDHVTAYNSPIGWDREQCSRCSAVVDSESVAAARAAMAGGK